MKSGKLVYVVGMVLCCGLSPAQTRVDLRSQSKSVDFGDSTSTRPVKMGTSLPAVCTQGELFFRSNAAPGSNLYGCTATNTWSLLSGGGNAVGASSAVSGQMTVFTDTTGRQLGSYAGTGVLKAASGVVAAVTGSASDCVRVDGASGVCLMIDPVTGVATVGSVSVDPTQGITTPSVMAPSGTAFLASGAESETPSLPAMGTLTFSATAHVPQFTRAASASVDATMVVPHDCGTDFVKTVGTDGTVTCATAAAGSNFSDSTTASWTDEFGSGRAVSGQVGALGWTYDKIGTDACSVTGASGLVNHPGVLTISSGSATAGDGCGVGQFNSVDGAGQPFGNVSSAGNGNWEMQVIFQTDPASTANYGAAVGTANSGGTFRTNDANLIRFDSTATACTGTGNNVTANWVYETITGGVATCVDSGVAVAASTWYWAHLKSVAGAVSMRIGTAPSAITQATVAVGNSTTAGQGPVFQVLTHTTATKKLLVDKYAAQITGLTR